MAPKINFIKKDRILSIRFRKEKSVDSDIAGNVVVDYNKKGEVVGIDIMDINLENFVPVRQMRNLCINRA
ncbi:DUF2283 domain-containing protein [Patescibacteria group bacterium]|nr:MAG: DUF2283 domain-containing protein [Patescibacteria group bacterium]